MARPPPPPVVLALGCVAVAAGIGAGMQLTPPDGEEDAPAAADPAGDPAGESAEAPPDVDAEAEPAEPDCVPAPLPERAAATLVVGVGDVRDADDPAVDALERAGVAGVFLTAANVEDRAQVARLVRGLRRRLGHDLVVATDEETGRVSSFRSVVGPTSSPRTTAQRLTPAEWRRRAAELGEKLAAAGVDWNFAPVADVDGGPAAGVVGDRSFSGAPEDAADFAVAFAEGMARAGVAPTVKHFPGLGGVRGDPHRERATVRASLGEALRPFEATVEAGVPAVMTGHAVHAVLDDDRLASLAPAVYELLRDELDFAGVAITDSVGMGAVHQRHGYDGAAPVALAAGADAVLASEARAAPIMAEAVVEAVEAGELAEDRLDEAATRVLTLAGADPEPVTCRPAPADFPRGPAAPTGLRPGPSP